MQDPHTLFQRLQQAYVNGTFTTQSVQLSAEQIAPFPEQRLVQVSQLMQDTAWETDGIELLQRKQFGRIILNGGMATRFGGRVKGVCEALDGKSFLQLKLEQMTRLEQTFDLPEIPVALMHSFATHETTKQFLEDHHYFGRTKIEFFLQPDAPRLTKDGTLYQGAQDRAARGHGDFAHAFKESGILQRWIDQGVTHIDFSNIDNLGATVHPAMLAAFVDSNKSMGVEVARKNPGDKGGSVGLKDGRAGIIEGFYFPDDVSQDQLTHFNTNNLWFRLDALRALLEDPAFDLPWSVVHKTVVDPKLGEQEVVQFEHVAADITFSFNQVPEDDQVLFFWVDREGSSGRFFPVKQPDDLVELQEALRVRLATVY